MKKKILSVLAVVSMIFCLSGCGLGSKVDDIKGQLVGNSFEGWFYDNYGEKFLTVRGTKIGMTGNIIKESTINSSNGNAASE